MQQRNVVKRVKGFEREQREIRNILTQSRHYSAFKRVTRRELLNLIRNVLGGSIILYISPYLPFLPKLEIHRNTKSRRIFITGTATAAQATAITKLGVQLVKGPKFDGMQPA